MTTLAALYRQTRERLATLDSAALDARLLVEHFTGTSATDIVCSPTMPVSTEAAVAVDGAIARRLAGEPVHRIIGQREFYGLPLRLSKDTLEPRPDTETLVDAVLPFVTRRIQANGACRILDLGTGTGAIALALLSQAPGAEAVGVDISEDALATARANAEANGLATRFSTIRSDWFEAVGGRFDVIVSNPPYIPSGDIATLSRDVREHDPMAALDGGEDGLEAYRKIAESALNYLAEGGLVGVEIGYDQRRAVVAVFEPHGLEATGFQKDFGGNDRVILLQKA